jgi:hypothetical protein
MEMRIARAILERSLTNFMSFIAHKKLFEIFEIGIFILRKKFTHFLYTIKSPFWKSKSQSPMSF